MTDILALKRMTDMINALDKVHNGLMALIDAHHELERKLDERIRKLECPDKDIAADASELQNK